MTRPDHAFSIDYAEPVEGWERALLDHQIETLNRLAAMGMAMAGVIERQVTGAEPGPDAGPGLQHAAMDFGRVARAVRLSFALQSRLIADFKRPPPGPRASAGADAPPDDDLYLDEDWPPGSALDGLGALPTPAGRKRTRLGRLMRHIAEMATPEGERREAVLAEAAERLERDDVWRLIATRSHGEVIAIICGDLGLEPDWDHVPHKPHRCGWATYEDIREARDFARRALAPEPTGQPVESSAAQAGLPCEAQSAKQGPP